MLRTEAFIDSRSSNKTTKIGPGLLASRSSPDQHVAQYMARWIADLDDHIDVNTTILDSAYPPVKGKKVSSLETPLGSAWTTLFIRDLRKG